MHRLSLEYAKLRLRIPALWHHFGFTGEPKTSCRAPWRDDHKPSFSVAADGLLWNDFATGEGGDPIDFLARASGLGPADACRKFLELAGAGYIAPARPPATARKPRPQFPPFERGNAADFRQLASLRNVSVEALHLARERGLLRFEVLHGLPAWLVTDGELLNAQARPFPAIAFCEGGPDLLAAFHFIHCEGREADCSAVAMLGASHRIHDAALPRFTGKRVRIFGHDDEPGRAAVDRWAAQLESAGADVDAFDFAGLRKTDGSAVKDLNNCTSVHADDFDANRELWSLLP